MNSLDEWEFTKLTQIVGSTLDDCACGYANMKWYKMIATEICQSVS